MTYYVYSILYPLSAQSSRPSSVLIHLPRGPPITTSEKQDGEHESTLNRIADGSRQSTVLSINYRLSAPFTGTGPRPSETHLRYPQPIHDVSEVFTYITEELVPSMVQQQEWPQIQLYGSRFGGALAAMLALTMPNAIDSVVVEDPIVDWVILDELLHNDDEGLPMRRKAGTPNDALNAIDQAKAAKYLIDMRTKLFPTPSSYFDAFASPTLFVRAPGRDTPWTHAEALGLLDGVPVPPEDAADYPAHDLNSPASNLHPAADIVNEPKADDVAESAGSFGPYDDDIPSRTQHPTDSSVSPGSSTSTSASSTTTSTSVSSSDAEPHQVKRRKVLRRWPPNHQSEDVSLPLFNIIISPPPANASAGTSESDKLDLAIRDIVRTQGTEFAELLKRACFFGRGRSVAEEGVTLTTRHSSARGSEQGISAEAMSWLQSQLPKQ